MSKELLRSYLMASAAGTSASRTPARAFENRALLSCFSNAPASTLSENSLAMNRETVQALCSEASLQSWFDPLDIRLDTDRVVVRFPHALFGTRFFNLFQAFFEHMTRALWGEQITFCYAGIPEVAPKLVPEVMPAPAPTTLPRILPAIQPETPQAASPDPTAESAVRIPSDHLTDALTGTGTGTSTLEPNRDGAPSAQLPGNLGLHPAVGTALPFGEEWTFDTFIANGKHKWALGLTRELTRKAVHRATHQHYYGTTAGDAQEAPGLLVLCGPHGTGKTHLLRAVGNELFRTLGDELFYASLSDLELRFATHAPLAVRQELATKSAILLDDFQHLARIPTADPRAAMQEELCLLLDRFMDQGKAVVIAGVGHPKDWNLDRALSSRLETGLWAELPEADLDVRLRYAQQQAKLRRLTLSREHLLLLAQHCQDIRRLSGVILRVASHRSLLGRDLSEQDLLNIVRQSGDSSALTPQLIVSIVGEHCGIAAKDILGEKRRPDLVQARQIAMYLCRELLGHSYPVIGRMFGGKDHSTVMHGVKKIKLLQERDRLTHTMVTELTKTCLGRRG